MDNESIIKLDISVKRIVKSIFDSRIRQESEEEFSSLETFSKAIRLKSLQHKLISFLEKNPNVNFKLIFPDLTTDKEIVLLFSNHSLEEETSSMKISVSNDWEEIAIYPGNSKVKLVTLISQ